jgi:cytochrome c556
VLLDFSYELDDAPRWERFYLVTGDEPFDLEAVRRAARDVAAVGSEAAAPLLEIPADLEQSTFTLAKETVS